MKTIEEYIELSKTMDNISDGGSAAYLFLSDDVVLVKYYNLNEYGIARPMEEEVARSANELNSKGVSTPRHIAVKRVTEDKYNYCYVLQSRAKGVNFSYYTYQGKGDKTLLDRQSVIANANNSIYEKCVRDLCNLHNMGLELKPKNYFYDEVEGFTFIDLLESNPNGIEDNIVDVMSLFKRLKAIFLSTLIPNYLENYTEEEKSESKKLYNKMLFKAFIAMEKIVPNFSKYKRTLFRTLNTDSLNYFKNNGYEVGDLTLTSDEEINFNDMISKLIENLLEAVALGKFEYWQIEANEIRIFLESTGMIDDYKYHFQNKRNISDYTSKYDYEYDVKYDLINYVLDLFNQKLIKLNSTTNNPNLVKAVSEMEKYINRNKAY